MCRRCGESDKRGSAATRRARKLAIIARDGDAEAGTVPCTWRLHAKCPGTLTFITMQMDRLVRGDTYRLTNIVASCGPCNRQRFVMELQRDGVDWQEGCEFGPEVMPA